MRIRCPKCAWQPDGRPYWGCERCCTAFDTFQTQARCPRCHLTWLETQCIDCSVFSLHEDWYDGELPVLETEEESEETQPASPGGA